MNIDCSKVFVKEKSRGKIAIGNRSFNTGREIHFGQEKQS